LTERKLTIRVLAMPKASTRLYTTQHHFSTPRFSVFEHSEFVSDRLTLDSEAVGDDFVWCRRVGLSAYWPGSWQDL